MLTSGARRASSEGPPLSDQIAAADRALFDAFNAHDIDKTMSFFSKDLEFFHDLGGKQSYDEVGAGFQSNFEKNNGLRRELVDGTLEIFPIPRYGAIETGRHRFCHSEGGKTECATFRFVHVWKAENGSWKLTRVVSFGH
jgi:ketosteroid isomerase-like protein